MKFYGSSKRSIRLNHGINPYSSSFLGLYFGEPGEYCGDVGEYCGDVGLY